MFRFLPYMGTVCDAANKVAVPDVPLTGLQTMLTDGKAVLHDSAK